eukprot:CAMPEP_0182422894 /NCGR_PEP_ID=MMETSP1167-20130531/8731_1 /TAXON_ID=2988 /ORGANISM="Mallomonas Sp, Strain CCMP3275" /LENGTH=119 /DNA_ID=CAMNT_0024601365 /DNA_START=417 /DNA_END=776 /DNA_ORIENTATION=+
MKVMCKRDPQVVRAFLGLTDENPNLNNAYDLLQKTSTLERVDPDRIDEYVENVDKFAQAISSVDSLSYNARSDYSSTETFAKGQQDVLQSKNTDYLSQTKRSVIDVRNTLAVIVDILNL